MDKKVPHYDEARRPDKFPATDTSPCHPFPPAHFFSPRSGSPWKPA